MWMREKLHCWGYTQKTKTLRAGELSERHVKQAEHSKPSRESKVDCELPGVTAPDNGKLPHVCLIPNLLKLSLRGDLAAPRQTTLRFPWTRHSSS